MSRLSFILAGTLGRTFRHGLPAVNLLLLLTLAALLAHWTWRFFAPQPAQPPAVVGRGDARAEPDLDRLRAAALFGGRVAANTQGEAPTALGLRLRGVFAAPPGRPAVALLSAEGGEQAVVRGDEVQPGVVLEDVAADHVILRNRGVRERLDLEAVGAPLVAARGEASLTREDISRALANPQSLGVQVAPQSNPLAGMQLVRVEEGGLAARLGLQSGDTVRMVNGMPVANAQELTRLLSDSANVERITVVGERQGTPLTLSYRLQQQR